MDKKVELISKKAVKDLLSTMLQDINDFDDPDGEAKIAEEYILERVMCLIDSTETIAVLNTIEIEL